MDVPEPPTIVLEQPAPCADAHEAELLLRRALGPSSAPKSSWTVTMRVTRANGILTAEGEIADETDTIVANRSLAKGSRECSGLARAVGVWASLVLDAEVERAKHPVPPSAPSPPPPVLNLASPSDRGTERSERPERTYPEEQTSPDRLFMQNPAGKRETEIGIGSSYSEGLLGSGPAIVGAHVFTVIEVGSGWFLRPSLALGRSTDSVAPGGVFATWGAARFDACGRMPGNYLEQKGIQIDVCGGADVGFLYFDAASSSGTAIATPSTTQFATPATAPALSSAALPLLAPGTSIAMRGELGSDLAIELRGLVGANLIRETYSADVGPRLVYARLEMGLSWRLR